MGSSRRLIELEEHLKEAGNILLSPPSSFDEVIALLDKVERLLAIVEQAPSRSMQDALLPAMKALIANELLRHPDMNVRLSVASCISEITRITAPEAPYDDELMKEIFRLNVVAFEKLSHASGRCYSKAISILDTVAKVRSCLLMLDLECDTLIFEMFQHFLKLVRSNHPHVVLLSMETIMTLVIDESEDVSWDLLSILLASVRKENQDVSPMAYKLGEKVITNCAAKVKKSLIDAVQCRGIALDEYAQIVAYICESGCETLQDSHLSNAGDDLATKELESLCLGEVCHDVKGISKSVMSNGNAPSRNDDSAMKDKSSKVLEQCSHFHHAESLDARCNSGPGDLDSLRTVKSKIEPVSAPRKRGRKPNSLMNPEEGYDHSWICTGRKTSTVIGRRKSLDKGADCLPSTDQDSKKEALLSTQKKVDDPTFLSPKSGLPGVNHQRRGRAKKQGSTVNQDADPKALSMSFSTQVEENTSPSADLSFGKEPEDRYDTEIKRRKRSKSNEVTTCALEDGVSDKDAEVPGDRKEKPQQPSLIKLRRRSINDDGSSVQADLNKSSLVVAISTKGITEASVAKKKKKKKIAKDSVNSSIRNRNWSEDTPKTEVKKKLTGRKEEKNKISKAAVKSLNEEGNYFGDTPKTEVKKNHSPRMEEKKISKAAVKSLNRGGNFLEDTPKTEVKKKHTAEKGEKKMISKASIKSSNRDGNSLEDTPKTGVKKKHTAGKEERKISFNVAVKSSNRDGNHKEKTPKTGVKRRHTAGKEEASGTGGLGEQLVGSKIKVWWPMDKTFYEGIVDSYDHIKKKHRVLYADGDEEILNLKRQRWELVEGRVLSKEVQETEVVKPNASSDILPKVKEETEFEHVKHGKALSLKRSTPSACASKRKAKKSFGNSSVSVEKHSNAEKSNVDGPKKDSSPKGDDQNSAAKLRLKDRKLIFTLSKPQQTVASSNAESLKDSHGESPDVDLSTREQNDNPVETSKEAKKGSVSKDGESNVDGEKGTASNDVETNVDGVEEGIASKLDVEKGITSNDVETNVNIVEQGIASENVETNVDGVEKGITSKDVETSVDGGEKGSTYKNVETNVDGEDQGIASTNVQTNVDGAKP